MQDLITLINQEFEGGKSLEKVDIEKLGKLMEDYQSNENDWCKYAFFDQHKYTRNLVDAGNNHFNLVVLCWNPGQSSPIHDHANSHCLFKCLDGELAETIYGFPDSSKPMEIVKESIFKRNQVDYMNDKLGLHKVSNNTNYPAISIHLYSPPILECKTFCQDSGDERASGRICFYSKFGQKTTTCTQPECIKSDSIAQISPIPPKTLSIAESSQIPSPIPNSSNNSGTGRSVSNSVGTAESLYSFNMGSTDSISLE
jgi:cysteine dioxygenase